MTTNPLAEQPTPPRPALRASPLLILAVLASPYTLYFARAFLLPVTFAILLNFLLSPSVRWLARLRIPPALGAAGVVLVLVGAIGFAAYGLAGPVQSWAEKAPQTVATARRELGRLLKPFERVFQTARQVETAAGGGRTPKAPEVVVRGPTIVSRVFGSTPRFLAGLLEVLILLYFLLTLLEFIPYLGALTFMVVIFFAALDSYQSLSRALLPPAAFLVINLLQVNLLSPVLQARRLALNPVAVFVGLAFWFWIWGIPGAFIGVPVLAAFKICCDHIESRAPVGEFLSAREETRLP